MWSSSFLFSRSKSAAAAATNSPFGATPYAPNTHGGGGGVVPPVLLEESRVPKFYKDCLAQCGATSSSQSPNTGLVYNLMVTSQLPKDSLSEIWTMVNRSMPGQLTRQEFFSCLALIALAQKGESLSALCNITTLPIPHLQTFTSGASGKQGQKALDNKKVVDQPACKVGTRGSYMQRSSGCTKAAKNMESANENGKSPNGTNQENQQAKPMTPREAMIVDLVFDSEPITTTSTDENIPMQFDILNLGSLTVEANGVPTLVIGNEFPYSIAYDGSPDDVHMTSWYMCAKKALSMIRGSHRTLTQSPEATSEVLATVRGAKFFFCVQAMSEVLYRVYISITLFRPAEKPLLDEINNCLGEWNKFCTSRPVYNAILKSGYTGNLKARKVPRNGPIVVAKCGVCMQAVSNEDSNCLQFAGTYYHSTCANFWVNLVSASLPKLESPCN